MERWNRFVIITHAIEIESRAELLTVVRRLDVRHVCHTFLTVTVKLIDRGSGIFELSIYIELLIVFVRTTTELRKNRKNRCENSLIIDISCRQVENDKIAEFIFDASTSSY